MFSLSKKYFICKYNLFIIASLYGLCAPKQIIQILKKSVKCSYAHFWILLDTSINIFAVKTMFFHVAIEKNAGPRNRFAAYVELEFSTKFN